MRFGVLIVTLIAAIFVSQKYTQEQIPNIPIENGSTISAVTTNSETGTTHSLENTLTYIKEHGALPSYYLTKKEAAARGWIPSRGNLGDIAEGMMIGGDIFTNAQHLLPSAPHRVWREADFEYTGGSRNAKRILYSNDRLVFVTRDHYKTVAEK